MNVYIYNAIFGTDLSTNITKGKLQSFVTDFFVNNLSVCPSRSLFAQLVSFTYIYFGFMVRSHFRFT